MRTLYLCSESSLAPLAESCLSLTPKVSLWREKEIFMDLSPTLKLFGGENKILEKFEHLKSIFPIPLTREVLCDRPEWARAIAPLGLPIFHLPPGESFAFLKTLPVQQLVYCGDPSRLEEERKEREKLVAFMKRVGLHTISDFVQLDETAIGRRFGTVGISLKQWISGEKSLLLPPYETPPQLTEFLDAEDIVSLETLLFYLRQNFLRLEARLSGRATLAKDLLVTFYLESGPLKERIQLSEPTRDAGVLLTFFRNYFNQTQPESRLTALEITVTEAVPFVASQLSLFDQTENRMADLSNYVYRLQNRLGAQHVGFAELKESYLPERSWKTTSVPPGPVTGVRPQTGLRPPVLFYPPKPFHPSKQTRLIASENLTTEWWVGGGFRRYFISESPSGEKMWVFLDTDKQQWFVQGTFD